MKPPGCGWVRERQCSRWSHEAALWKVIKSPGEGEERTGLCIGWRISGVSSPPLSVYFYRNSLVHSSFRLSHLPLWNMSNDCPLSHSRRLIAESWPEVSAHKCWAIHLINGSFFSVCVQFERNRNVLLVDNLVVDTPDVCLLMTQCGLVGGR